MAGRLLAILLLLPISPCAAQGADRSIQKVSIQAVERIVYGASAADLFRRPAGLAIDRKRGVVVVADTGNHRLVLFDAAGRARGSLSWASSDPTVSAGEPRDLAMDARARLFVLDALHNEMEVLNAAGSRLGFVEPDAPIPIDENRPQSLDVGASGRIYVLYVGTMPGVLVVNPDGSTAYRIGFEPASEGLLKSPTSLAVDDDEQRIVVTDPIAPHQVRVFDLHGNTLASFGEHGEGDGTLSVANFVCWGPGETIWVVDTVRHCISVFDSAGRQVGRIGGFGRMPGQFYYPSACGFLSDHQIVVLERGSSRFQVLALDLFHSDEPRRARLSKSRTGEPWALFSDEEVTKE